MLFTIFMTFHLVGVALGLGGATIGDLAVLRSLRRGEPAPREHLDYMSQAIWLGLALLAISGIALFVRSPSTYLSSSGFIAKMVVVSGLVANGLYLQRRLPSLRITWMTLVSGAISSVSWYGALAVAMLKTKLHLPLADYIGLYVTGILVVAALYAFIYRRLRRSRPLTPEIADSSRLGPAAEMAEELDRLRCDNEALRAAISRCLPIDVDPSGSLAGVKKARDGRPSNVQLRPGSRRIAS
jgi:hypothetical protein